MKTQLTRILKSYGIVIAFVLICVALSILLPVFLSWTKVLNVIRQSSIYGVMAVGMTFVILSGGIDLSVGSVPALAGVVSAGAATGGVSLVMIVVLGLLAGLACGRFTGLMVTVAKITPFVVTLGMMSIARGLTLIYSGGRPISGFTGSFRFIGGGRVFGIPFSIIVLGWGVTCTRSAETKRRSSCPASTQTCTKRWSMSSPE